jgi:hypothetical protein
LSCLRLPQLGHGRWLKLADEPFVGFASSRQARLAFAVAFLLIGITVAAGYAANPEAAGAAPRNSGGAFAGTWAGVLTGSSGGVHNERIVIVVNAGESSGTWTLSTTCRGRLTLDSISGGYHHFRRRVSSGAACAGGDVDCLMLVGVNLYDSVTPHPGGVALSGTLRRVRHR